MDFKAIAEAVGVEKYPASMEEIYNTIPLPEGPACDLELIDKLQTEYNVFGQYHDLARQTALLINEDENFSTYIKVCQIYASDDLKWGNRNDIRSSNLDGDLKKDFLGVHILVPMMPAGIERYKAMGFSKEKIADYIGICGRALKLIESRIGRPALDNGNFSWDRLFACGEIFRVHGLEFQFRRLRDRSIFLKNKKTGQLVPVMLRGEFEETGRFWIGSKNYTDVEPAFVCKFSEDDENYYGHGVVDTVVSSVMQTFPKAQWDCVGRPNDLSIGVHFPKDCDISQENFWKAIKAAREMIKENLPEYANAPIDCSTWLFDPALEDILGPDSKIVKLAKCFVRTPIQVGGMSVFGFVFPSDYGSFEELPENTRLERGLKQLYLNGGCNYSHYGMLVE